MSEVKISHRVLVICIAYEQGYGYGWDERNLPNPYPVEGDEKEAWDYGYSEGKRKWLEFESRALESE